ncbi:MAG: hemerythrin family protein [Treponema sp.]|nr:hemerythrin family protein [Treponema sp.]
MEKLSIDDIGTGLKDEPTVSSDWVKWSPNLELGIPVIDRQHKHLVGMCNDLHEGLMKFHGGDKASWRAAIATALRQTVEYARTHFADEEKLMRASNFEGYEVHKQHHHDFILTVSKVLVNFEDVTLPLAFDFADYLRDWILSHVACEDKLYCPVIKAFYRNFKLMQQQAQSQQGE